MCPPDVAALDISAPIANDRATPPILDCPVPDLPRITLALGIGTAGGLAFHLMHLPLPWMLGALFTTMVAAVARAPVVAPARLRPAVVAVIGVLLGSRFTPDVLGQMGAWVGTLAILMGYVVAVALTIVPFYRYFGKLDWTTAYFAGMPGGLSEMIEMGEAAGGKAAPIILAHSLRVALTIAVIAFWFRIVQGLQVGLPTVSAPTALSWADAALLLACAIGGSWLGVRLRLTAPTLLGPMLLSAGLHLSGLTESTPPTLLVNVAQVILGTVLGCRFHEIDRASFLRAGILSTAATLLTLLLALVAGQMMRALTGVEVDQALLALAPGGLTEMGLIAIAIHADVAFVALHHVVRILFILMVAPFVFRVAAGRR
jgi:membrane AbrB-like protein